MTIGGYSFAKLKSCKYLLASSLVQNGGFVQFTFKMLILPSCCSQKVDATLNIFFVYTHRKITPSNGQLDIGSSSFNVFQDQNMTY